MKLKYICKLVFDAIQSEKLENVQYMIELNKTNVVGMEEMSIIKSLLTTKLFLDNDDTV